ncbi:response regulator [Bradyrhizobium canariense]|uniref:Response regulator receiver domain-containing protein n=1 Tax=Bradyrhizobium canariense TaxID=255045 RepID=A0A1H1VF01_9BRAD|nr:response regulator [Bradyrhizobium canariense]SDS82759.1 Response regulator receiver domain-containing protein [Bradyrhizobium canariense]
MTNEAAVRAPAVILIVEDDSLLRELAVEIVEEAGFITLEAGDAAEAVGLLETRTDIAVVFTDINMPGRVDGTRLAYMVSERWPSIKILVSSGQARLQQCNLPSNSAFLGKPYRGQAVIAQLHSLVGAAEISVQI